MENKKVIIIGAGVTGLCAGIYLRKAGYEVGIYEMHSLPGGMCTGWIRKGYTFDGCIDWLMGSSPDGFFYDKWREVGALDDTTKACEYDIYSVMELASGKNVTIYTDPDKLEAELLAVSSEDRKEIKKFIGLLKMFSKMTIPSSLGTLLKLVPLFISKIPTALMLKSLSKMDMKDYAERFKNPELKELMLNLIDEDVCAIAPVAMLGYMAKKTAGFVVGGSLEFAKRIEKKYLSLGGKVFYNSRVREIIIDNGKAVGIKLDNKEERADYIVSAADGYDTIYRMLGGKFKTPMIEEAYSKWKLFPTTCQVSLGVASEFKNEPPMVSFITKKKIAVDPKSSTDRLAVRIFNFDRTLAPAGKTSLVAMLFADYEYWSALRKSNKVEYGRQKERLAKEVIEALDTKFPGLKSKVEVVDVATPVTYERYNNEWKGSWEGFWPNAGQMSKKLPSSLPGLSNFWMAGQWLVPGGGLPTAIMEGARVCKEICKVDKK